LITEPSAPLPQCRLCGAAVRAAFSLQVLGRHQVAYLLCSDCGSLQTEPAWWLEEAYAAHLARLDTGAAQRVLTNLAASYIVSRILGLRNVLDFGGGDGLLCRLLRDHRINCFVTDKYAPATYALGFTQPDFRQPGLLLAFEVVEHFENPRVDLELLFQQQPQAILASTTLYSGQGPDWWYLTPETGQHLFFYSRAALERVAHAHGYRLVIRGYYILFVRTARLGILRNLILALGLSRPLLRLTGAVLRLLPTRGVTADFDALRNQDADERRL
jgi:hypothetical protein